MRRAAIGFFILLGCFWIAAGAYLGFIGVEEKGKVIAHPVFFIIGLVLGILTLWRLYRYTRGLCYDRRGCRTRSL